MGSGLAADAGIKESAVSIAGEGPPSWERLSVRHEAPISMKRGSCRGTSPPSRKTGPRQGYQTLSSMKMRWRGPLQARNVRADLAGYLTGRQSPGTVGQGGLEVARTLVTQRGTLTRTAALRRVSGDCVAPAGGSPTRSAASFTPRVINSVAKTQSKRGPSGGQGPGLGHRWSQRSPVEASVLRTLYAPEYGKQPGTGALRLRTGSAVSGGPGSGRVAQ